MYHGTDVSEEASIEAVGLEIFDGCENGFFWPMGTLSMSISEDRMNRECLGTSYADWGIICVYMVSAQEMPGSLHPGSKCRGPSGQSRHFNPARLPSRHIEHAMLSNAWSRAN